MDWLAMVVLCGAYALLPRRPRWGTFGLFLADIPWAIYSVATQQVPLLIVSVWCGSFALYSAIRWKES